MLWKAKPPGGWWFGRNLTIGAEQSKLGRELLLTAFRVCSILLPVLAAVPTRRSFIHPRELLVSALTRERPSIRDVARNAGISGSTVSRVLNVRPDVALATRECVLQAIAELNYHPNAQAVGLSCRSTGVVGLVVPDVITPLCTSIITPLTTVRQSLEYMGQLAVEHLCSLIAGETDELLQVTVETELVVRASCGSGRFQPHPCTIAR